MLYRSFCIHDFLGALAVGLYVLLADFVLWPPSVNGVFVRVHSGTYRELRIRGELVFIHMQIKSLPKGEHDPDQ